MAGPNANLPDGQELVTLPFGNDVPWYFFTIGLSGSQYTLTMRYNTRMARWIMMIGDSMNNVYLGSVPMLIDRILTGQFHYLSGFPVGTFFTLDGTNTDTQPTRYSFGTDHLAYYLDPTGTT
jgi:hypothetical protein